METSANNGNTKVSDPEATNPNIPKEINKILTLPPATAVPGSSFGFPSYPGAYNPSLGFGPPNVPHMAGNNYFNHWNPYQRRNPYFYDPNTIPNMVARMAEDKMKPTFKSIEMILQTFNSINMILESTYSAIHGSFRTITNVADHLIFIRNHLAELALISRLANFLVDFLRWLLKLLGLSQSKIAQIIDQPASAENIWRETLLNAQNPSRAKQNEPENSSLWPVFVFFSVVIGTPYIVWRLLGIPNEIPQTNRPEWTLKNGRHFTAIGLYNFKARNQNELSFNKGQILFINPEALRPDSKWLMACIASDDDFNQPPRIGLVPLNFVKLLNK